MARVDASIMGGMSVARRSISEDYKRAERRDEELKSKVEAAINADKGMRGYDINVRVQDEIVHLEGMVDVLREKQRAQEIASGVHGVRDVENNLTVSTDGGITDGDVEFEIAEELRAHGIDTKNVWVNVESGVARIRGRVASLGEAKAAVEAVAKARGVKDVVDETKVVSEADTPAVVEEGPGGRDDASIVNAIKDAMDRDPYMDGADIRVNSEGGRVTLDGEVASETQIETAEEIATGIPGVKSVESTLVPRVDAATSRVNDLIGAIESNPLIAELAISVTRADDTIRIEGEVETIEQKRAVEQAIDLAIKENPRARVRIDNRIVVDMP